MATKDKLTVPALRGVMGDWVYYSCLLNMAELANRVGFAQDIHKSSNLSDMIQRQLKRGRSGEIADYLSTQSERFFNSLVVATYGGEPYWHAIDKLKVSQDDDLADIEEHTLNSVGFLTLSGTENLFAIDGQHRLAGIQEFLKRDSGQESLDEVSVIFVSHKTTDVGRKRTRRLFTTLNKTAKPVSKGDIISLDEDDTTAICVRWLIEESQLFAGNRIAFVATNNMPPANSESLTTIGNLYDVLTLLFAKISPISFAKRTTIFKKSPLTEDELNGYKKFAKNYFELLREAYAELDEFFSAEDYAAVVLKHRNKAGGKVMFRPLGLEVVTKVIISLVEQGVSLSDSVKLVALLPRDLDTPPFRGLLWDSDKKLIVSAYKVTLRETLLYMLGKPDKDEALLGRIRKALGSEKAGLPKTVSVTSIGLDRAFLKKR